MRHDVFKLCFGLLCIATAVAIFATTGPDRLPRSCGHSASMAAQNYDDQAQRALEWADQREQRGNGSGR